MDPEERLRLLQEALWYMRWTLVFGFVAVIVETAGIVEIFIGGDGTWVKLWALAGASWLIGIYLRAKAREYRQRADGIEKNK